ncbi:sensor histidine kinase [Streptomyces sp. HPF1205]|uniref:sensor histidine kinase n=1 Tax=Streptomyces sp. HPF1205 TaxID=2873262 RepID=UPI001CEC3D98|nr:sensor histidine kinase [Streptomyces sp. HPF1205]
MRWPDRASRLGRRVAGGVRRAADAPDLPLVAAAVLAALALLQAAAGPAADGSRASSVAGTALALAVGSTAPLAFARAHLVPAAAAVAAAVLLTPLSGALPTVAGMAALAAVLHLVGLRCAPPVALLFAVPFVAYAVAPVAAEPGGKALAVSLLAGAAAALSLGAARRRGRETAARTVADWAYADTLLQNAARGERARIARELHDIVAHHISSLSVQAETARLTTPGLPPLGAERLLAIGETARLALTEMRGLLGVLREDTGDAGPARDPQPGLDQLLALVDGARDATGAVVRLTVSGHVRPLDPGVELAAYRIVQEALTNARRHAPGCAVDVELRYARSAVRIRVQDAGAGGSPRAGGHGLLGMRERAAVLGGTVEAGPGPAAGFLVTAQLPVAPAPAVRATP